MQQVPPGANTKGEPLPPMAIGPDDGVLMRFAETLAEKFIVMNRQQQVLTRMNADLSELKKRVAELDAEKTDLKTKLAAAESRANEAERKAKEIIDQYGPKPPEVSS